MINHRISSPVADACWSLSHRLGNSKIVRWMPDLLPDARLRLSRPGLRYGPLPLQREQPDRRIFLDRLLSRSLTYGKRQRYTQERSLQWLDSLTQKINHLKAQDEQQRYSCRVALRLRMHQDNCIDDALDDALAHACLAVEQTLQLIPRPNQCLAARAMLNGYCVEMATGEGKTLSIALAGGAAALSGTPVHVLTANDYLAERDASNLESVYRALGVRATSVLSNLDPSMRRRAYEADIVYVTAKQVAFDWLSDTLESQAGPDSLAERLTVLTQTESRQAYKPVLRGLCLALIDEADSLLVDEARIPLVLATAQDSGAVVDTEAIIALTLAEQLQEGVDYNVLSTTRLVQLTDNGRAELSRISNGITHIWQSSRYREESVVQALTALHRFERDRDYIVRDGRVELLDSHTGRAMPDRRLPHGLQRLLELKEKCSPTIHHETIASVPFQHFFQRYFGMVGISGTLKEVSGEVHHIYGRFMVHVPPHRPSLRLDLQPIVFVNRTAQLQATVNDVQQRQEKGQPVLVCTRSVEQSLGVSAMLTAHGLAHQVLNAYQDADEAAIVAIAGQVSQITVATNMAGRGTDIPLGETVEQLGGLHVISLAFNDARRLDRQLAGRAARQGEPGSFQQFHSLDDPSLAKAMPTLVRQVTRMLAERQWHRPAMMLIYWAQRQMENKHRRERLALYQTREKMEQQLAFGGRQD